MLHLDLFSGIGGFAYAIDQVFEGGVQHIFCDNDKFCQQVLKKHWPESEIYDDIKQINSDSLNKRLEGIEQNQAKGQPRLSAGAGQNQTLQPFILTGGFPCQPFSAAGLRRGTADERHLWPEMLRVIRLTQPEWVIAENVRGILTWNDGLVFEQVCSDLEASGYEVQPLIIPAVALNAPHRRDRVWFIGHAKHDGQHETENAQSHSQGSDRNPKRPDELRQPQRADSLRKTVADDNGSGLEKKRAKQQTAGNRRKNSNASDSKSQQVDKTSKTRLHTQPSFQSRGEWSKDWLEVATQFCSVDDGLSVELDGFKLSKSKHRAEQLKAYGNAIVPQVAIEIMKGIAWQN